jgi:LPPG:FO 2-phospho-L-lactate transferase
MDALRADGEDVWFNLGDEDLAICVRRAQRLAEGATLTETADELRRAYGVAVRVLPMTDAPVRTWVKARGAWAGFQEFMIRARAEGPVEDVAFRGAEEAAPSEAVLAALSSARAVIVGPSNPVISIGPMLALPGLRDALRACPGPVVAVSPLVRGVSVKGPTETFLAWAGRPLSSEGIAAEYDGLLDGLVADERTDALPTLETDVAMPDAASRRRLAQETLDFALALGG